MRIRMEKKEFEKEIKKYAEKISITLQDKQINQFYDYMNLLLEWNSKINLTAITKPEEVIVKHFIDSITISENIGRHAKLVDVGTGAGFPGIPLKIIRPDIEVTLLDSLNKRILFLEEVIKKLSLEKIEAVHARVEEFGRNKKIRESFDIATSRAVANMAVLAEYMLPLIKIKGLCVMMKGSQIEEELKQSKNAVSVLGGKVERVDTFELPLTDIKRTIITISKECKTPSCYPRKPGIPAKTPIQ